MKRLVKRNIIELYFYYHFRFYNISILNITTLYLSEDLSAINAKKEEQMCKIYLKNKNLICRTVFKNYNWNYDSGS